MVVQELRSRYLVKDNLMQARRTLLASSAAFFELAQKCNEPIFLFLYLPIFYCICRVQGDVRQFGYC
jgi:hypothetical protein